jgi:large subunit ribosomal protein L35
MPKQKPHTGSTKRFRVTATGKVMRAQTHARHYLEHKSSKRTRRLSDEVVVAPADRRRLRRLLGR